MEALVRFSRGANYVLPYCHEIGMDGGGGSRGYMQVASGDSFRMRQIEGMEMAELVFVGGLLWMGGDSLLVPVWRSAGVGFTGKGESDVWVVMAST